MTNRRDSNMGSQERLIEAATQCLLEHGNEACSVKAIAEIASVNHGLVHHYFKSKEQLMITVLKASASRGAAGGGPEPTGEEYKKMLIDHLFSDPHPPRIMFEMIAMSRSMPTLKTELLKVFQGVRKRLVQVLDVEDDESVTAFMSALIGLSMYSHIDRRVNFRKTINTLLEKLTRKNNAAPRKVRRKTP